jgi:hypothetical protein
VKVAFVGPLTGPLAKASEETLLGLRTAAAAGAGGRPVEVVPFDDREDPKAATEAILQAQKEDYAAVVAVPTSVTVDAVATRARKGRTPVILAGSAWATPSIDPEDTVFFTGSWPADQGLYLATFLSLHSDNAGIGLYRDCLNPALVAEDSPRGRELADAVERNLGPRQKLAGRIAVPPHGAPSAADLKKLKDARCDRLVLLGEPDLVDATAAAMKGIGWEVPFFCGDGMLSAAAAGLFDGTVRKANFLQGVPAKALPKAWKPPDDPVRREFPSENLQVRLDAAAGAAAPVTILPRVRAGWLAGWIIVRAAETLRRPSGPAMLDAVRGVTYTEEEERSCPIFDSTGRAHLVHWFVWKMGEKGPEPIKPEYLPTRGYGPLMRQKLPAAWDAVPVEKETKIVWLTFGEPPEKEEKGRKKEGPKGRADGSRTIEEDMAALGLGTMGYEGELDPWILDELMVRTLGKINRLFLKNYDGTFVPGVSFNIHFTTKKPDLEPSKYWVGLISGEMSWDKKKDEPTKDDPGGKYSSGTAYIYSRWMRFHMAVRDKRMRPGMNASDRKFIDGTYSWGTTWEENLRSDSLRGLLDGYADGFAMTGAHEFGHGLGCGHDTESKRSIMNVVDAVGLGADKAVWIPAHVKSIETAIGRYGVKKR